MVFSIQNNDPPVSNGNSLLYLVRFSNFQKTICSLAFLSPLTIKLFAGSGLIFTSFRSYFHKFFNETYVHSMTSSAMRFALHEVAFINDFQEFYSGSVRHC